MTLNLECNIISGSLPAGSSGGSLWDKLRAVLPTPRVGMPSRITLPAHTPQITLPAHTPQITLPAHLPQINPPPGMKVGTPIPSSDVSFRVTPTVTSAISTQSTLIPKVAIAPVQPAAQPFSPPKLSISGFGGLGATPIRISADALRRFGTIPKESIDAALATHRRNQLIKWGAIGGGVAIVAVGLALYAGKR
jgi:hypothetical protein